MNFQSPISVHVYLPGLGARRNESDTKQRIAGLGERNTSGPSSEHVRHRARTVRARADARGCARRTALRPAALGEKACISLILLLTKRAFWRALHDLPDCSEGRSALRGPSMIHAPEHPAQSSELRPTALPAQRHERRQRRRAGTNSQTSHSQAHTLPDRSEPLPHAS